MAISRREFSKLGALGIAAHALSPFSFYGQSTQKKIGYCVIGLGRIADHHMRGIAQGSSSQVVALVSGHRDKAERIAAQYGVPKTSIYSYEELERIRDNKAIDAVIVCLPNSMHAEYTVRSAKTGKHVLCEKPMSVSVPEAEEMIAACKAANVKLMIAYRLHYEPINLKAIKLIRDGTLGRVEAISSVNGFNIARGEWRSTHALGGGGPLMDVGIYSLNAVRYLTGEEPDQFTAVASTPDHDGRFDGVEENLVWTMRLPSGTLASCATTYGASMPGMYKVFGSKGTLEVGSFNYQGLHLKATYKERPDAPAINIDETNQELDPMQFVRQIDHFSDCIAQNRTPNTPGEEGLRDMQYIRSIYRAAGIDFS
ncbi:MAG: Gfo/Idh/MocA family oxidoreductase [Acidobacteria bacterium]|nr:Gfo/Idh/MocA family oxidoreductase [Acidobacteriota bacterium]